jgi:hypothetical protein
VYDDSSLGAWYVYPSATDWPNTSRQQAFVLPNGFVSRGMSMDRPAPHNSILLFRRRVQELALIDHIACSDRFITTGISWRGRNVLISNPNRIGGCSPSSSVACRSSRAGWRRSLCTTLDLEEPAPGFRQVSIGRRILRVYCEQIEDYLAIAGITGGCERSRYRNYLQLLRWRWPTESTAK